MEEQDPILQEVGRDPDHQVGIQDPGHQVGGQDHSLQEGGRDHDHRVGGRNCHRHVGELVHDQPVGGLGPDQQKGRTDRCAYIWGDQIITPANEETLPKYATEDDVPRDYVPADRSDVPNDVDGDHRHPDEGGVPKTPEEGDVQKSLDKQMSKKMSKRMSKKMSKKTTQTLQTEISAGKTKNQLEEPAGKEPKTTVNSAPTAKTAKSKVEKKEAESPEVSTYATSKSEKPTDDLTYMKKTIGGLEEDKPNIKELEVVTTKLKKVKGEEFSKSTTQTRMMELEPESSPMIGTEAPDNDVTAEAAPPIEVTSEASREPTALTPAAAEENPAEDKSEEAKEDAADDPMETFTKPVVEDTQATDNPTSPAATEASPTLEPGGNKTALEDIVTTLMVIPKNRKSTKKAPLKVQNNQIAQVQVTFSKVAGLLTDYDDAFTGRAFPFNPETIGPMTGTVNKPKVVEPGANAAQDNMTSNEASKMARPGADPPEVAREGTKEGDVTKGECDPESDNHCSSSRHRVVEPPDKLPMTATACDKIHIFAEGKVTFESLLSDPDSQPPEQFNKHGQAAEIIKLHLRRIFVTDDFMDMMPSYHNVVKSITESDDPPLNVSRSKGERGRQLEAPTEGEDSDDRHDEGVHDDHHQKPTLPNHEITSPVYSTYKSIAMGEQDHGVKACLITRHITLTAFTLVSFPTVSRQ
jgi:hypothetical protein